MVALILGNLVKRVVEAKLPVSYTVCVSPNSAAKMWIVLQPVFFIFKANEDVLHPTFTIWHKKPPQGSAKRVDGGADSGWVSEGDGFRFRHEALESVGYPGFLEKPEN